MTSIRNGREIDYGKILANVDDIIEALEYDSMRSAGKVKINASQLNDLYTFRSSVVRKQAESTKVNKVKKED